VYGWGDEEANGHGREERTPQRVAALVGQCVKLMNARDASSCAVTKKGELSTWGAASYGYYHGHGLDRLELTRVDGLSGVEVAAVVNGFLRQYCMMHGIK